MLPNIMLISITAAPRATDTARYRRNKPNTLMQRNADFRIALEPADTRTMTGTRIDDDQRGLGEVETILNTVVRNAVMRSNA